MTGVTIVVATYNRPAMLEVELESILAAKALVSESVRILVVDDCSTIEGAEAITERLGVDYMRLPHNVGVAGALYAGFCEVDSDFYSFWGDDDFMLPRWFKLHLAKIAEGFDVVAGSFWKANSQLQRKKQVILPVATLAELRKGNVQCNDGSLVRRSSVDPSWMRPERERAMMMTFWLAMASNGRKFASVREPTWLYRRHDTNMSNHRSAHDNALRAEAMAEYA